MRQSIVETADTAQDDPSETEHTLEIENASFEELLYTSWFVDRPAKAQDDSGVVTLEVDYTDFSPLDVPFEELPFTSWVVEDPALAAQTTTIDTNDWVHLPAFDPYVDELFKVILGRPSDDGGRDFWSAKSFGGTELSDIADIFLDSFEFTDRWGEDLSDEDFVEGTYLRSLGRDADEAGKEYWVERLADDDFGRGDMAAAFARFTHDGGEDAFMS
ncbi:MAG: DUF4214 domain-containing protein [Pseudomonadota bacterium]